MMAAEFTNTIIELTSEVKELTRTIRGYNGNTGIVTQIALVEKAVSDLSRSFAELKADVQGLKSALDEFKGCNNANQAFCAGEKQSEKQIDRRAVTWEWVRDRLAVPVVVAVILGVLNSLPKIFELLNR